MSPTPNQNPVQLMPQYPTFSQPMAQYYPPSPPQSYSSGMGGYNFPTNFPTFAPSPYTFSSNIYQNTNAMPQSNYSSPPPPVAVPPAAYGYSPMNNAEVESGGDCLIS